MNKCIVVIGRAGSGKSVTAKKLALDIGYEFIEVSDVVRDLTGRDRSIIRHNKLTGIDVGHATVERMNIYKNFVVSGVRQKEVIDFLRVHWKVKIVVLDLNINTRLKRINKREPTSWEQLALADQLDDSLGFKELMSSIAYINKDSRLEMNLYMIKHMLNLKKGD